MRINLQIVDWSRVPMIKFVLPAKKVDPYFLAQLDQLGSDSPIIRGLEFISNPEGAYERESEGIQTWASSIRDLRKHDDERLGKAYIEELKQMFYEYVSHFDLKLYFYESRSCGFPDFGLRCRSDEQAREFALLSVLIALASDGKIYSLRRCSQCKRWMHTKQANQSFCSKSCRQAAFQSSPEVRAKRNVSRRQRYYAQKALDLGARIRAMRGRR